MTRHVALGTWMTVRHQTPADPFFQPIFTSRQSPFICPILCQIVPRFHPNILCMLTHRLCPGHRPASIGCGKRRDQNRHRFLGSVGASVKFAHPSQTAVGFIRSWVSGSFTAIFIPELSYKITQIPVGFIRSRVSGLDGRVQEFALAYAKCRRVHPQLVLGFDQRGSRAFAPRSFKLSKSLQV